MEGISVDASGPLLNRPSGSFSRIEANAPGDGADSSGARNQGPIRSRFKSTAMTMSAPIARHSDTGTGLTKPPSTSRSSSYCAGVKRPGNASDARTASLTVCHVGF